MYNGKMVQDMSKEIDDFLAQLGRKYNSVIKVRRGTYDDLKCSFTIEGNMVSEKGDPYVLEFNKYCGMYALTPADYRKPLHNGEYLLVGFNLNSPKFGLKLIDTRTGKEVKGNTNILKAYK